MDKFDSQNTYLLFSSTALTKLCIFLEAVRVLCNVIDCLYAGLKHCITLHRVKCYREFNRGLIIQTVLSFLYLTSDETKRCIDESSLS
jgi:hypothetical protein